MTSTTTRFADRPTTTTPSRLARMPRTVAPPTAPRPEASPALDTGYDTTRRPRVAVAPSTGPMRRLLDSPWLVRLGVLTAGTVAAGALGGLLAPAEASAAPRCGSCATLDSDGDGLSNRYEQRLGTDPDRADTDRDGAGDGREVARGTDPLRAGRAGKMPTWQRA